MEKTSERNDLGGKALLVIDDEPMILDAIRIIFEDMGITVDTTTNPDEGIAKAIAGRYDLILTDIRMPSKNGAEITEAILQAKPSAPILIITGYPNDPLVPRAMAAGARALVKKPFEIATILDFLRGEPDGRP